MGYAEDLARRLEGTATLHAEDLAEKDDRLDELTDEVEIAIYKIVDVCTLCGWWFRKTDLVEDDGSGYWCRECEREIKENGH